MKRIKKLLVNLLFVAILSIFVGGVLGEKVSQASCEICHAWDMNPTWCYTCNTIAVNFSCSVCGATKSHTCSPPASTPAPTPAPTPTPSSGSSSGGSGSGSSSSGGGGTTVSTPQPHSHSYSYDYSSSATCTSNGYSYYRCSCGDSYRSTTQSALGHNYELVCNYSTTDSKKCTRCGDVDSTPACIHKRDVNLVVKDTTTRYPSSTYYTVDTDHASIWLPAINNREGWTAVCWTTSTDPNSHDTIDANTRIDVR